MLIMKSNHTSILPSTTVIKKEWLSLLWRGTRRAESCKPSMLRMGFNTGCESPPPAPPPPPLPPPPNPPPWPAVQEGTKELSFVLEFVAGPAYSCPPRHRHTCLTLLS